MLLPAATRNSECGTPAAHRAACLRRQAGQACELRLSPAATRFRECGTPAAHCAAGQAHELFNMASLFTVVNNDLKQAMSQRQELKVSVLRMLLAALNYKRIALGKNVKGNLTEEQAIQVVQSEIKKRKDAINSYKQGGRQDLVDKETKELAILEKYLPKQLADEEIEGMIKEVIGTMKEVSMKNFGQIIGQVMSKVKGQAEGSKVSQIVKKVLADQ
jgi:uncharacterized protein YqeY